MQKEKGGVDAVRKRAKDNSLPSVRGGKQWVRNGQQNRPGRKTMPSRSIRNKKAKKKTGKKGWRKVP